MNKKKKGNVMNKLTKEVQRQYLPAKIRQMQEEQNPEKFESKAIEETKTKIDFSSKLEFNGGIEEFLLMSKMANKKFEPLQEQVVLQNLHNDNKELKPGEVNKILLENTMKNSNVHISQSQPIQIPKRPKWKIGIKPKEFEDMENEAYLNWRRSLSEIEEKNSNLVITPYEKNISVWRQLWITIEKCQILIQIVDARNPLFFRSEDLEKYIKEVNSNKDCILLINKADMLSQEMRISWSEYFKSKGIKFLFFSAMWEDEKIDSDEMIKEKPTENKKELISNEFISLYENIVEDDYKIYSRNELISLIKDYSKGKEKNHNSNAFLIGFIGYPNVGKSSVINVLMKKKKVGVAMMPGKTKHYQTLFLPDDSELCLMDCPGLVFPSFTHSKADLVLNGISPIDKIVDYLSPIQLAIINIPKVRLEEFYKIKLPDLYSSSQFLQVHAIKFGYYTGRSIPSEAVSAKIVLKDYVNGDLLYCYKRPDFNLEKHGDIEKYLKIDKSLYDNKELLKQIPADFDDNYEKIGLEMEGRTVLPNYDDLDKIFFGKEEDMINLKNIKITKDIKMQLKFAMKRGEISEEEYESIDTFEDAKKIMEIIDKRKKNNIDSNIKSGIGQKKLMN